MQLDDLLSQDFEVSDALDPARRAALASACQQLDVAPARPSLGAAESMRVEAERQRALRYALTATRELVVASRFDLQVLAVLLRLLVEVEGVAGVRGALSLVAKLLDRSWGGLELMRAETSGAARDKLDRRRGSYLDAVFAQIYFWLARERERAPAALAQAFALDAAAWLELLERVDACLARCSSKISRWEPTRQALDVLLRVPNGEAPGQAAPVTPVAPVAAVAPAAAAVHAAPASSTAGPRGVLEALASAAVEAGASASNGDTERGKASDVASAAVTPSDGVVGVAATAVLEVSPRFWELQRRLAAFGALLDSGQIDKARIVARELGQTLEHFDVAGLFPGLFAGYFELSARHAEALSKGDALDSARSAALAQLSRTDLTRFMQLSLERRG